MVRPVDSNEIIDCRSLGGYKGLLFPSEHPMATLTIRKLDPSIKERLRVRAAEHGHSMEAEARRILQTHLKDPARRPERNLYERIRARFEPLGGVDLELPPREFAREPPRFE